MMQLHLKAVLILVTVVLMAMAFFVTSVAPALSAITCHSTKGRDGYWAWRQVDGKRCWYRGNRGVSKSNLQWVRASNVPGPRRGDAHEPDDEPNEIDLLADFAPAFVWPEGVTTLVLAPIDDMTEAILNKSQSFIEPVVMPEEIVPVKIAAAIPIKRDDGRSMGLILYGALSAFFVILFIASFKFFGWCFEQRQFEASMMNIRKSLLTRFEDRVLRLDKPLFVLAVSVLVMAQATPMPKVGQCPSGYRESGGYCAPMTGERKHAMPKVGQCPSGYAQSGNYCLEIKR